MSKTSRIKKLKEQRKTNPRKFTDEEMFKKLRLCVNVGEHESVIGEETRMELLEFIDDLEGLEE